MGTVVEGSSPQRWALSSSPNGTRRHSSELPSSPGKLPSPKPPLPHGAFHEPVTQLSGSGAPASGPLVAWPEDGSDSPTLLLRLLQQRRSVVDPAAPTPATASGAVTDKAAGPEAQVAARVQSARLVCEVLGGAIGRGAGGGNLGVAAAWPRGLSPSPKSGSLSPVPDGTAVEVLLRSASVGALRRAQSSSISGAGGVIGGASGHGSSNGGGVPAAAGAPKRARLSGSLTLTPPDSPPTSPRQAGATHVPLPAPTRPASRAGLRAVPGQEPAQKLGGGLSGPAENVHVCGPGPPSAPGSPPASPGWRQGSRRGPPATALAAPMHNARSSTRSGGDAAPADQRGQQRRADPTESVGESLPSAADALEEALGSDYDGPPPARQLRLQPTRQHVHEPSLDGPRHTDIADMQLPAEAKAKVAAPDRHQSWQRAWDPGTAEPAAAVPPLIPTPVPAPALTTMQVQVQPARAAAARHPSALRTSIGLLPSQSVSPSGRHSLGPGAPWDATGDGVGSGGISGGGGGSAAAAPSFSSRRPGSSPSSRAVGPGAAQRTSSPPPASAQSPASSPGPSQQPSPMALQNPPRASHPSPPLPGLPSFLGAPVILDPGPSVPMPHGSGPGTPGPGLGPSLSVSRTTSFADRALSYSAAAASLQAASPSQPGAAAAQSSELGGGAVGSASMRVRHLHGGSASYRSNAGRGSFRRSGSYFKVREAVPEAVLENLPGVQAARGRPAPPPHPGAIPDEAAADVSPAPADAGAATAPLLALSSYGSLRRYGMDLTGGGSGPPSTAGSGGGGVGAGVGVRTGSLSSHASWLRRAEAMPPVELLPIPHKPPPLALDHLQPASVLSVARAEQCEARASVRGGAAGDHIAWQAQPSGSGGVSGDGRGYIAGLAMTGALTHGWPRARDEQAGPALLRSLSVAVGSSAGMQAPRDAAVAPSVPVPADAAADGGALMKMPTGLRDAAPAAAGPAAQLHLPHVYESESDSDAASMATPDKKQPPGAQCRAPPPPPLRTSASKPRVLNLAGLGLSEGGAGVDGDNSPAAVAAAAQERDALLALLGSTRMLSSVLTATHGPRHGARGADPALHGPYDPHYDPTAHLETLPEHFVESRAPPNGGALLLGNTRMGSTVFSPPQSGLAKLTSLRRPRTAAATARAAMPDLELLSRCNGGDTVVAPDGRKVRLHAQPTRGSVTAEQLELPPPEDVVAAVNGHLPAGVGHAPAAVPAATRSAGQLSAGGGGGGGGGGSWRGSRTMRRSTPGVGTRGLSGVRNGELHSQAAVLDSGDDASTEERSTPELARGGPSYRALAAHPGLFGRVALAAPRSSTGSGSGVNGRPSGAPGAAAAWPEADTAADVSGGLVSRSLLRHLSVPTRRAPLVSGSGFGPPRPPANAAAGAAPPGRHSLVRKPSLIAAGLNMLKRAFSLRSAASNTDDGAGDSASWQHHGPGDERPSSSVGTPRLSRATPYPPRGTPDYRISGAGGAEYGGAGAYGTDSSAGVTPQTSRRRLLASQRSFVKHSAVLGWVQQVAHEDEAAGTAAAAAGAVTGAAGDGSGGEGQASQRAAHLQSLQALLVSGSGALTCDAVVAFDDGTDDGAARHRIGARGSFRRRHGSRCGTGGQQGDTSDESAAGPAPEARGWMARAPAAGKPPGGAAARSPGDAPGGSGGGGGGGRGAAALASPQPSSSREAAASPGSVGLGSPPPSGDSPPPPHHHHHQSKLLGRIGSKLGRNVKRGSSVVPVWPHDPEPGEEHDRDRTGGQDWDPVRPRAEELRAGSWGEEAARSGPRLVVGSETLVSGSGGGAGGVSGAGPAAGEALAPLDASAGRQL